MPRPKTIARKLADFAFCSLVGLVGGGAVLGIAFGGLCLAGWVMIRADENAPPPQVVLESGAGRFPVPPPAGTSGTLRLAPPPLKVWAYEVWEEARYELEGRYPYDAALFLPGWDPSLAYSCEYFEPLDACSNLCEDATCKLLVFAEPGGDASTWNGFLADGKTLERDLAGTEKKNRRFVAGKRSYGFDSAPEEPFDSVRFVWIAGCRFALRCEQVLLSGTRPMVPSDVAGVFDAWIDGICDAAGVSCGAPDADEIARGDAWAAPRREAGEAMRRKLDAAEKSGMAAFRRFLREVWCLVRSIVLVTGIGCLSVTLVWALALAIALAVFGRKRTASETRPPA